MPTETELLILSLPTADSSIHSNPHPNVVDPKSNLKIYKFLGTLAIFSELPEKELKILANSCYIKTINAGQTITIEGDDKSLYGFLVISGRMAVMKSSLSGKELIVELLPPGDLFGLIIALSPKDQINELYVRAELKSEVISIPISALTSVLSSHPRLYKNFFDYLLVHLQSSYRISRGLAHDSVEVRIAMILLRLAQNFARELPAPQDQTIDITRQQLAELTGTTTESAIRATRLMEKSGLIDVSRPGVIRVLNLLELRKIADQ